MIDLIVLRDSGDREGDEITNPLITSVEPAVSRGTQEIEAHAPCRSVSLKTVFRPGVRKGQIITVHDSLQGPSWRGVLLGLSHVVEAEQTYSILDVERPI